MKLREVVMIVFVASLLMTAASGHPFQLPVGPICSCIFPADCQEILPPDPNDPCACPQCADPSPIPATEPGAGGDPDKRSLPLPCPLRPCVLPADCLLVIPPSDPCGCPTCGLDCSTVLCLAPDCPPEEQFTPEGQCCPQCKEKTEQECDIEGQVFQKCGSACPPTCANPNPGFCIAVCVSGCQCPQGQVLDEVAQKCVQLEDCTCPPDCTLDFCGSDGKHNKFCNIPGPREIPGCTGQCQLTTCKACYFSEDVRPLPEGCKTCPLPFSLRCLKHWGRCIHRADINQNGEPDPSCITDKKFKCYKHPCPLRG